MFEQQQILKKIEVELSNQTLILEKSRQRPIGFQAPPPQKEGD